MDSDALFLDACCIDDFWGLLKCKVKNPLLSIAYLTNVDCSQLNIVVDNVQGMLLFAWIYLLLIKTTLQHHYIIFLHCRGRDRRCRFKGQLPWSDPKPEGSHRHLETTSRLWTLEVSEARLWIDRQVRQGWWVDFSNLLFELLELIDF